MPPDPEQEAQNPTSTGLLKNLNEVARNLPFEELFRLPCHPMVTFSVSPQCGLY